MRFNYFFLEAMLFLVIIACCLLCSCKALPIIPDSEYDRYLREREYDERNKDFQERVPHIVIPRR